MMMSGAGRPALASIRAMNATRGGSAMQTWLLTEVEQKPTADEAIDVRPTVAAPR